MSENPSADGAASFPSLGAELRKEREIRRISLKEIADSTKISKRYLEAIERDDYQTLPAPVFTRGFVREYARYLGLKSDDLVDRYMLIVKREKEEEERLEELPPPIVIKRPPAIPRDIPRARLDLNIIILVLLLAALGAAAWWLATNNQKPDPAPAQASTSTVAPITPAPQATPPRPVAEPLRSSDDLVLRFKALQTTWVSLDVDGEKAFKDEIPAGEEKVWRARNEFRFRSIGNAGGVEITLNDMPLPSLGDEGEVLKDRIYDRAFVTELTSAGGRAE